MSKSLNYEDVTWVKKTEAARSLGRARLGRRTAWVARDLGSAWPRFFSPRSPPYNRFVQQGSESLDSFSLRSDCCVLDFIIFFFLVYFDLYERLETLNFFKFCWYINQALDTRFPCKKRLPHQTMKIKS